MKGIQKLPEQPQLSSLFPIVDHWNPFSSSHDGRRLSPASSSSPCSPTDPRTAFTTATTTIPPSPQHTSSSSATPSPSPPQQTSASPSRTANLSHALRAMMKPTDLFRDQVNALWACFKDWNECEQTLVLYSLLKGVSGTQAKFLSLVLEQALTESDLQHVEREANDPDFVRSLNLESKEDALGLVLSHLPLLQPSSTEAKAEYLKLIPDILSYSQEKGTLLEEAHQLFTYLVIHPALSCEEQLVLPRGGGSLGGGNGGIVGGGSTRWLGGFDGHTHPSFSASSAAASCYSSGLVASDQLASPFPKPSLYAPNHQCGGMSGDGGSPPRVGLLGVGGVHDWYTGGAVGDGGGLQASSNSFHQPLTTTMSAPPAVNSTDDGHLGKGKRNSFLEEKSGMKDVPMWLKSLRLHKYTSLFESLDYNEMMLLSEKQLEEMEVTKGARNKIMLSIHKLKERQQVLRNLEKDIMSTGSAKNLRNALNDVKNIINTPIQAPLPKELRHSPNNNTPTTSNNNSGNSSRDGGSQQDEGSCTGSSSGPNPAGVVGDMRPDGSGGSHHHHHGDAEQGSMPVPEGDLPGQITRFMGKMCTQLLMSPRPHEETITQYLQLLDKCYNHEAFTPAQKSKLLSWRKNCQKFSPNPYARKASMDSKQTRGWNHYPVSFSEHSVGSSGVSVGTRRPVSRQPFGGMAQPHLNPLISMGGIGGTGVGYRQSPGSNMYLHHRQSLGGNPHSLVQRTKSAPNHRRASQPAPPTFSPGGSQSPGQHPPLTRVESSLQALGEPDITDRLERLCRSVTEHALGDEAEHNGDMTGH